MATYYYMHSNPYSWVETNACFSIGNILYKETPRLGLKLAKTSSDRKVFVTRYKYEKISTIVLKVLEHQWGIHLILL